jgi:hypothetical protein
VIFDFALCRRLEILSPCREDRGFGSCNFYRKGVGMGAEIGITERGKGF